MDINNRFNRLTNPQFGMALKIKPNGERYLKGRSKEFLTKLEKAGEDMVDFKHYDLEVNAGGLNIVNKLGNESYKNPVHNSAYTPMDSPSKRDVALNIECNHSIDQYPKTFYLKTNEEAKKTYSAFADGDNLDRHILLTKMLENQAIEAEQKELDRIISRILDKFSSK